MDNELKLEGVIERNNEGNETMIPRLTVNELFNKEKANFLTIEENAKGNKRYTLQSLISLNLNIEQSQFNDKESKTKDKDSSIIYTEDNNEQCLSVRFDSSSNYIASGYSTGQVAVFNLKDNKLTSFNTYSDFPITSVRWKPLSKTIALAVSSDGLITQLHSLTGKPLYQMKEEGNQIMCVDYSNDGSYFATCGDDKSMRLYDDNTKMIVTDFPTVSDSMPEITNRLFAVRFSPTDSNMLIGGGWDSTVHIFDLRQKSRVNYIFGPHICGDGIDIKDRLVLTTSWTGKNQVCIWDLRTMKAYLTLNIELTPNQNDKAIETNLYTGRFNQIDSTFAIGGANRDMIRVYDYNVDSDLGLCANSFLNSRCDELAHPCYSIDFSSKGTSMIYSGYDSIIRIVNIK